MEKIPDISFSSLHIHVTGSVNSSIVPYWINWSRRIYPDLNLTVSVTNSATDFVSLKSLSSITDGNAWRDSWDSEYPSEVHSGLENYADVICIFPATINTVMQVASGFTNTPMQMALQLTSLPVVIARAFPGSNKIMNKNLDNLLSRENYILCDEVPAYSLSQKDWKGSTGFYYPNVLKAAQSKYQSE